MLGLEVVETATNIGNKETSAMLRKWQERGSRRKLQRTPQGEKRVIIKPMLGPQSIKPEQWSRLKEDLLFLLPLFTGPYKGGVRNRLMYGGGVGWGGEELSGGTEERQ